MTSLGFHGWVKSRSLILSKKKVLKLNPSKVSMPILSWEKQVSQVYSAAYNGTCSDLACAENLGENAGYSIYRIGNAFTSQSSCSSCRGYIYTADFI